MNQVLLQLLEKLKVRQSWCPYCGGEYVHSSNCVLRGLWFPDDPEPKDDVPESQEVQNWDGSY